MIERCHEMRCYVCDRLAGRVLSTHNDGHHYFWDNSSQQLVFACGDLQCRDNLQRLVCLQVFVRVPSNKILMMERVVR